jgi:dTDP-4-amino-4,6-dideoxygalactose transaminase
MKLINYTKHKIYKSDFQYLKYSLRQKKLSSGKIVKDFENKLKIFCKSKYSLTTNSATSSLLISYMSLNVKEGDIIILPIINFIAAANMAKFLKLKIYFCDVDPVTGQSTPELVEKCIKENKIKKIKIIVTMYLGGHAYNVVNFYKLKLKYRCYLIEDACHALGSKYFLNKKSFMIGSCKHSDISTFSFHPAKTITTGEGGLITTNSYKIYNKAKQLCSHGLIRPTSSSKDKVYKHWKYDSFSPGFNFRLSDINCALGLSQLKNIKKTIIQKINLINIYKYYLKKLDYIEFPSIKDKSQYSSVHLLNVIFRNINTISQKEKFLEYLAINKVICQIHYNPMWNFKSFQNLNPKKYLNSKIYYIKSVSLPLYSNLTSKDVKKICRLIIKYYEHR